MSKQVYIRKHESLSKGGRSKFYCKICPKFFYRKDEIRTHSLTHKKIIKH